MNAIESALQGRRVIVCVGSGGVGKTTLAATIALRAACEGRKVVVCTIDPARRLANALGLGALGTREHRVDLTSLEAEGVEVKGELSALMLDPKRSWDELVEKTLPPDRREAVLENRFYQTLSSALAGSQEYIAMEKLIDLRMHDRFDLVVLDTPPTAQALDFLHAPDRVLDFLDNEAARTLLLPAFGAGKLGLSLLHRGGGLVLRSLARLTGAEVLRDLASFLVQMSGMYDVFKDRAARVKSLLGSEETAFVLVTTPQALPIDEALAFHGLLQEDRMPLAGVIANRIHRDPLGPFELPSVAELRRQLAEVELPDSGEPPLSARLQDALLSARAQARADEAELARLMRRVAPTPRFELPRFESEVYDLGTLYRLGEQLASQA